MKLKIAFVYIIILSLSISCASKKENDFVVIGIPTDIETLNPLYSFSVEEGNVTELLYLSLLEGDWNLEKGDIEYKPMLAKEWEWNSDNESVIVELRNDVFWSDGMKCTIDDVIFSFDIYSDPVVKSRAFGFFDKFYLDKNGKIDIEKTFEKIGKNRLKINFKKKSKPNLLEIDHPILPKHYFEQFKREDIPTLNVTETLVTNGAYKFLKWNKDQAIFLIKNNDSFLINKNSIEKIIFKVIPEYQMRVNQFAQGEIDLMEDIKTDDIAMLSSKSSLKIIPISGRDFDYIGWNNISPEDYKKSKIVPHKLFGSVNIRQALTFALNREVVTEEYLSGYAQLASTPLSPIFTNFYDSLIVPMKYNPELSAEILKQEGWIDSNGDGTIDKNGIEFEFTLHIPSGNPRREFAASLFQNNLKAIGINMTIELNELGVFIDNLFSKQYDAWMAAWVVPIPINLNISWQSNLENTQLNFASYQSKYLDELLKKLNGSSEKDKKIYYKEIQKVLYYDQPYSFLYWIDNIAGFNKRISNVKIDPLGAIKHCWEWRIAN